MEDIERKVDKVLSVSDRVKRTPISDELNARLHAIPFQLRKVEFTPLSMVLSIAASILFLVGVNFTILKNYSKVQDAKSEMSMTANEGYFDYLNVL